MQESPNLLFLSQPQPLFDSAYPYERGVFNEEATLDNPHLGHYLNNCFRVGRFRRRNLYSAAQ